MTIRSRAPETIDDKTREVLDRRAERLRAPAVIDDPGPIEWLAEFAVGDEQFAVSLGVLRSVVPLRRVTPVPLSRPHVIGILRFGGQILTAMSLASLLGIKGWKNDPAVLLVIDPGWGRLVAIDCEEVPRPVGVSAQIIADAKTRRSGALIDLIHEGRAIRLIEVARLLDRRTGDRDGA